MRKLTIAALMIICLINLGSSVDSVQAQAGSAYDLIAAVNQLRAANGLPPYKVDGILMSIAQNHSEYQASIRTVTHYSADGSRPLDRAIAAGFGGGSKVFVSENIAGGNNLSISTTIYNFWADALHMSTMLNPNAQYIGAGVAFVGDYVYYTIDVGYNTGAAANPTVPPGSDPDNPVFYDPFVKSTPTEDNAIIHIVGFGQTLIGIANSYEIPLADLLALNNFTMNTVIYPGEEIIIQPASTPQPSETPTPIPPTSTLTLTPTIIPTATRTPRPTRTAKPSPTSTEVPLKLDLPLSQDTLVAVIGGIILVFVIAVVAFRAVEKSRANGRKSNSDK